MNSTDKTASKLKPIFTWLHLKRRAGQSVRAAFGDSYRKTDRMNPQPFVSLPPEEWNDSLNNYRVPLGNFDYRHMLFAKTHLYEAETFDDAFEFTVVGYPMTALCIC